MKHSQNNGQTNTVKENKMAPRKKAGITGSGGTNVDPWFNQSFPPSVSTYPSSTKLKPTFRPGVKDPMPQSKPKK